MNILKQNIVSNIAGKFWNLLIGLAVLPVYLRLLGPEAFGLVAFFATLQSTLQILDFGLGATISRELARSSVSDESVRAVRDLSRTLELIYFFVAVCIGCAFVLLAPVIASDWLRIQTIPLHTVRTALAEMGIAIALLWPCSFYNNGLVGLERQALQNGVVAVLYTLRIIGVVCSLILFGRNIQVFFLWQIAFGVVQLAVLGFFFWHYMPHSPERPRFQISQLRRIWRFTVGLGATGLVTFVLSQMDKILLSRLLPLVLFGYYNIANQISIASRMLPSAIFTAFFPRFSALVAQDNETELRRLYHRSCQLLSLIVFPASMTGAFFSEQIIHVWTGNLQIAQMAGPIASVLLFGSAINSAMGLPYDITLARGWASFGFYQNLISAILFGPLIVILVRSHGGLGAAIAWALLNFGYLVVSAPIIHAKVLPGELRAWYLNDVGGGMLVSAIISWVARLMFPVKAAALLTIAYVGSTWIFSLICCAFVLPEIRRMLLQELKHLSQKLGQVIAL